MDISWRLWANDVIAKRIPDVDENSLNVDGPPSYLIHLFSLKPPQSIRDATNSRIHSNSMALAALRDLRHLVDRINDTLSIYEKYLTDDSAWVEETASSRFFASQVTLQVDTDHQ